MRMMYWAMAVGVVLLTATGWSFLSRSAYESAAYEILAVEGSIEIREYRDLELAITDSSADFQGEDGSFMRLFRFISGANDEDQKIAMTTPVFMNEDDSGTSSMGFVLPAEVAQEGIPQPSNRNVRIRTRPAGRFAVIRFAGRLSPNVVREQLAQLRSWLLQRNLIETGVYEVAGYDPPFTPGPLRRNEILLRLADSESLSELSGGEV